MHIRQHEFRTLAFIGWGVYSHVRILLRLHAEHELLRRHCKTPEPHPRSDRSAEKPCRNEALLRRRGSSHKIDRDVVLVGSGQTHRAHAARGIWYGDERTEAREDANDAFTLQILIPPPMAYGAIIPGLMIDGKPAPYGVVNERAVRATAGIMFLVGIFTFSWIQSTNNYIPLMIVVPLFWVEFFLKTVFDPRYSIFGIVGTWATRRQRPEWVGAAQKRFAWSIGLILASIMLITSVGFQVRGWLPFTICMTCLAFMWMESTLGICAGCAIYSRLLRQGVIKMPEHRPACPGGACAIR